MSSDFQTPKRALLSCSCDCVLLRLSLSTIQDMNREQLMHDNDCDQEGEEDYEDEDDEAVEDDDAVEEIEEDDGDERTPSGTGLRTNVCTPVGDVANGCCFWLIAGPVQDHTDVDPLHFNFSVRVRAAVELTGREVFARAVPRLVSQGHLASKKASYETLRLMSCTDASAGDLQDRLMSEPSWVNVPSSGEDMHDNDCIRVLRRAAEAVSRAGGRTDGGNVTVVNVEDVRCHAAVRYALRLLKRRSEKRAVRAFRVSASFQAMTPERQRRLVGAVNGASMRRVRAWTELDERVRSCSAPSRRPSGELDADADNAERQEAVPRATRRRMPSGTTAPKVLPSRKVWSRVRREAVDDPKLPKHAMLTLDEDGSVRVWLYVFGSASTGVRFYRMDNGTCKRLAAPHLRRGRVFGAMAEAAGGSRAPDGDAGAGARRNENEQDEPNPNPADHVVQRDADGLMDTLAQIARDGEMLKRSAPTKPAHHVTKSTYLEFEDGTGRELVVAVEFDAEDSLRLAFRVGGEAATCDDAVRTDVEATIAGDGGPVRRTTMTIFTITASSSLFRSGRTPLMAILFLLSGEQAIHSAVGRRLQQQVQKALRATYSVPVVQDGEVLAGASVKVRFPYLLRMCGDFAILCHFLSLTGGSDLHRCPSWWLCLPKMYLSALLWLLTHPSGEVRNPRTLSRHWELVVWTLARWAALSTGRATRPRWVASGGRLASACPKCDTIFVARSTSPAVQMCQKPTCPFYQREGTPLLPTIAYTPLSEMFRRLRRALGGSRGYPLMGDIPFIVQPPVLHGTGNIAKKLVWFQFSLLSEDDRNTARARVFSVLGRSSMGSMYLREFGKLVALAVADEGVLDVRLDPGVIVLLQLSQLVTASWRRAIGTSPPHVREGAAATLQLAAAMLAILYAALKPCDPRTKMSGVYNLYLHAAMAHVRSTVGVGHPTANHICDDNIEGRLADMNQFVRSRTNNVSRGESVVNKQALESVTFVPQSPKGRGVAEHKIFTQHIVCCPCIYDLSKTARQEASAVAAFAEEDPYLAIKGRVNELSDTAPSLPVLFTLPAAVVDTPSQSADTDCERSAEEVLQLSLHAAQHRLAVCCCGKLTGRAPSPVSMTAMQRVMEEDASASSCELHDAMATFNRAGAPSPAEGVHSRLKERASPLTAGRQPTAGASGGVRTDGPVSRDAPSATDAERFEPYEPIEGERVYNLLDDMEHSDEEADRDAVADETDTGLQQPDSDSEPLPPPSDQTARFLLQFAAKDATVASLMPARSVVDLVFQPMPDANDADHTMTDADAAKMQEDVLMLTMLLARLHTPTFLEWVERDGILVDDVRRAAERLKSTMLRRISRHMGKGNAVTV